MKLDKKLNIKVNKELKEYLYMLVGKELTYEDKEKILSYFNNLKQQNDRMKKKAVFMMTILQWRIGKAIKYIKSFDYYIPEDDKAKLLDILKGSDKE